jgi:large subunit ribosomal protein L17
MVTEFFENEKIVTTVPKAKELRSVAEKMITLGKRDTLHAKRQALSYIRKKPVVFKLFETLAPRYADRDGGYTRILRLGIRKGDNAEMAILELVGSEEAVKKPEPKKKTKAKAKPEKPAQEKPEKKKSAKKTKKEEKE